VLIISDSNFDNFLKDIDREEEEIEEIKFKLKKKQEKELKSITVIK
jgi:predicted secreted Zn-dependent protease